MTFFAKLYDLLRHLNEDSKWSAMLQYVGGPGTLYAVLFAVVFAETGLVILPFLPGDTLIFAVGAMAHRNVGLSLPVAAAVLIAAAVLGDAVNYWVGHRLGPAVFSREDSKLLNKKHLLAAQAFYEKHGAKTIVLARFVPIVRTFAPFVAGVGRMSYPRFLAYNLIGGVAWVLLCLISGYLLGGFEFVKKHFEVVVLVIIAISLVPILIEFLKARRAKSRAADPLVEATTLGESPAPDARPE